MKAVWNGVTIAESEETIVIEGNQYFHPNSVKQDYLIDSDETSVCPWKGEAKYYDIVIDDKTNPAAAWYYPSPKAGASERVGQDFSNYIAFWNGVDIS